MECATRSGSCRKAEAAESPRAGGAAARGRPQPPASGAPLTAAIPGTALPRRAAAAESRALRDRTLLEPQTPLNRAETGALLRSLTGAETPPNDGEGNTGEGPAPSPPLCGARGHPGGDGAAIVLGQETGASPRRSRGRGANRPSRGNKQVIDTDQRPITAGGSALGPPPPAIHQRGAAGAAAPPHAGTRQSPPDGQGCPAPCREPAQSERAGRGRPRYSNQPHGKVASGNVTRGGAASRAGPAPEPIRAGGRGAAGPWDAPALSAPPRGVANSDMLTRSGYKNRTDAPSQHSAEVPAGRGFVGRVVRPALFFSSHPRQPPRAPEEVSPGPFPRDLRGSHGELPEERQAGLSAHRP